MRRAAPFLAILALGAGGPPLPGLAQDRSFDLALPGLAQDRSFDLALPGLAQDRSFDLALPGLAQDREGVELFEAKIRPVLVDKCYRCHSAQAEKVKAGLLLDSKAGMLRGGDQGPSIKPGDPEASLLVKAIRWTDEDLQMPPKGRLPAEVVRDFEAWIRRGAPDPRTEAAPGAAAKRVIDIPAGKKFWSFRPLGPAAPPEVKDPAWVRTPLDRFVLAKLEEKGLKPNPAVDRRRQIRRASLALLGLPPAPEEVEAFVDDPAPDAYGRLLDRLLDSPRYGERWARHWLDVARFAESHGFEQDYDRENAWPYRDFVIQALNRDLPYDTFVQWQIAGDELAPDEPLAWMATGFLGAGAFPTQLTEVEFEPSRYDELDSMVSTIGQAMLGLSVGCARCHDHKYDPIPAQDYYRLAATFTAAIRSHVEFDLDPEATRRALAAWEVAHAPLAAALEAFDRTELAARFDRWAEGKPWEKGGEPAWIVLDLAETKSHGGAAFKPLEDGSVLASGENPKNDRWTFTARTGLAGITAVRVEALKDASLKKGGPGRADNGNFALTDFRVTASPAGGKSPAAKVNLVAAKATFEQNSGNLSAAASIDADKGTGWAVDPQFGKDHAAVFELAEPAGFPGGTVLVFEFEFNTNVRHAIGRPRLSVSTRPRPAALEGESRPQAVAELLAALRAGGGRDERALAAYRAIDPERQKLARAVRESLARKPEPKKTTILVTTEGLKPLKHHADDRGFPHFYKETHVLSRGDVNRKQGVAAPGFLQVLAGAPEGRWAVPAPAGARTPLRRSALARWIADVDQGAGHLLARVVVNRLWHHHFGRGIVATPRDFGAQGDLPTHPELLDWLAGELARGGWRLKPVHKLILSSAVWLQSSGSDAARAKADPDNRLWWRREVRRLEGEAIRDSMLAVSGLLDGRMFGPGTLDEAMTRRSVYFFVKRSKLIPAMMVFDAPEPLVSIGSRPATTVAPQALLFMNSPQVRRYAAAFAKRLPAGDPVDGAYRAALGRAPAAEESAAAAAFLADQEGSYRKAGRADARERALADFCQTLFCLNEFVYVD